MNDLARVLDILKQRKQERFALATVIRVQGSAYRHEGAKMLIDASGETYGIISGGCLEQDLIQHALEALNANQSTIITYDLMSDDDPLLGPGPGCNGKIEVYLEIVGWELDINYNGKLIWSEMDKKLDAGLCIAAGVRLDPLGSEKRVYYCEDGAAYYNKAAAAEASSLLPHLENDIGKEKQVYVHDVGEAPGRILIERYRPKEKLYIFGAGPDVEPVVQYANHLDFSICLIDPRGSRCRREIFPNAEQLIVEFPDTYLQKHTLPLNSLVLMMTHNFDWDQKILQLLQQRPPRYVGILGPRKRTERLLDYQPVPAWIHSPVGIKIYAEGAEEIAISIIAELISIRKQISRGIEF